jgi:HAD superfamily hydrolase (TIGR01509 family)
VNDAIRLVCFDLGGVLVRVRAWSDACKAAGVAVRSPDHVDLGSVWRPIAHEHETGQLTRPAWAERLCAATRGLYSVDELCRIHDATLLGEYDGVADVVDRLRAAGVSTACLSNTNEAHWNRMLTDERAYPSVRRLEHRLASHLLGVAKPDEAAYRAVENATGRLAAEILFFDDVPANVDAARRIGWNAEIIDPARETAPQITAQLLRYRVVPPLHR